MRAEPPIDDEADYDWPVWAGVMSLDRQWGALQQDPRQQEQTPSAEFALPEPPAAF